MSDLIRKATSLEATGDRTARFVASDETPDRYGDIVLADGWDVSNFKKNPQFLFGHRSSALPIGRVTRTWVDGQRFLADTEWLPKGLDDFADKTWELVKANFLRAVSVGFLPKKRDRMLDDDGHYIGTRYIEQELLELSLVPIPANPNALLTAKAFSTMNLSAADIDLLFEPRESALNTITAANNARRLTLAKLRARSSTPITSI